ncbi:MAG: hypothetical protein ACRC7G_08075 [Beijerinckiaceae bacterium]
MFRGILMAGAALLSLLGQASAQEVRLGDISARLYLEGSGKLSEDLLKMKDAKLADLPRGEGVFGEAANTVVFNVALQGAKNTQPKNASAIVSIITTNRTGQRKTETRPLLGFVFNNDGVLNRPIVVENVTCSKVEIEVKARGASKRAALEFSCTEPKTAEADKKQPPKR